jgi:hypothetical protein
MRVHFLQAGEKLMENVSAPAMQFKVAPILRI